MTLRAPHSLCTAAALAMLVLAGACRPDPGPWGESDDASTPVPRLTVGLFYNGPSTENHLIDNVHNFVDVFLGGASVTISQVTTDRLGGEYAWNLAHGGLASWGLDVRWDGQSVDLSSWTVMHVAFRSGPDASSQMTYGTFQIGMQSAGAAQPVLIDPARYGYVADGQWHQLAIPMADFAAAGLSPSMIRVPFLLAGGMGKLGDSLELTGLYFSKEAPAGAPDLGGTGDMAGPIDAGGTVGQRALPDIYRTGKAINYSAYRAGGPGVGEVPSDGSVLQDLGLLDKAGYNLLRLFGADPVADKILRLAAANYPKMRFQLGIYLEGAPANCQDALNQSQITTGIQLAQKYANVATVSVGNETSFARNLPVSCLASYITMVRSQVAQPVTADDDYTFYAGQTAGGEKPDTILPLLDFVSIHIYPFAFTGRWDWQQQGAAAGPARASAMMNASLVAAKTAYSQVAGYPYTTTGGMATTVGATLPIVIGETGWKARPTAQAPIEQVQSPAIANPVNSRMYFDLLYGSASANIPAWQGAAASPLTIFWFEGFDEAWKGQDDGWGLWDASRTARYALCGNAAGPACSDPIYAGAGYWH